MLTGDEGSRADTGVRKARRRHACTVVILVDNLKKRQHLVLQARVATCSAALTYMLGLRTYHLDQQDHGHGHNHLHLVKMNSVTCTICQRQLA